MESLGLTVAGVSKRYGAVIILDGVSLSAPRDKITAVVGRNGAGKSTLFHVIMGLVAVDCGSALLDGHELLGLPLHEKARYGLGFLPQEGSSFAELTVRDNLRALLEIMPLKRRERLLRLRELIDRMGLGAIAGRRYGVLSRGEQRRVEIAKSMVGSPSFLLLDEPFSGLDPAIVEDLADLLRGLVRDGVGILMTDHNAHVLLSFVDEAYLLANGKPVMHGTPRELMADDRAKILYLGERFAPVR